MRIKKRTGDRIFKIVAVLFVTLFALICLYPLMICLLYTSPSPRDTR